jgi:hypothetical protein
MVSGLSRLGVSIYFNHSNLSTKWQEFGNFIWNHRRVKNLNLKFKLKLTKDFEFELEFELDFGSGLSRLGDSAS